MPPLASRPSPSGAGRSRGCNLGQSHCKGCSRCWPTDGQGASRSQGRAGASCCIANFLLVAAILASLVMLAEPSNVIGADIAGCSCGSDSKDAECLRRWELSRPPSLKDGVHTLFDGSSWERTDTHKWDDYSGNGGSTALNSGKPTKVQTTGHGAASTVTAVAGGVEDKISFFPKLTSTFSVCTLARYVAAGPFGRIFQGKDFNTYHGFQGGRNNVGYYQGQFGTPSPAAPASPSTDWTVFCGQNGAPWRFLSNGADVGLGGPIVAGEPDLMTINVNNVNAGEESAWEVAAVYIWSRALTAHEMGNVSQVLVDFLQQGSSRSCPVASPTSSQKEFQSFLSVKNWGAAKEACELGSGSLATIWNQQEQDTVLGMLKRDAWIGLSDSGSEGAFAWSDFARPTSFFTAWQAYEPSGYMGEDCVEMKRNLTAGGLVWADEQCTSERAFVCAYCLNGLGLANDCKPVSRVGSYLAGCACASAEMDAECLARYEAAMSAFLRTGGMYSRFDASSWGQTVPYQWDDTSGNGRNGTLSAGAPRATMSADHGTSKPVFAVRGGVGDAVTFTPGLPPTFTMCAAARYQAGGPFKRIFEGVSVNLMHGWERGHTDVAFYNGFGTGLEAEPANPSTDFHVFCGQNGAPHTFLADGVSVGTGSPTGGGGQGLSINRGQQYQAESSAWEVAGITIWERALSAQEMTEASQFYMDFLTLGADRNCPAASPTSPSKAFRYFADTKSWADARAACVADGGDLTTIWNLEEQMAVQQIVKTNSWLGLTDAVAEGTYVWADGAIPPSAYSAWDAFQPNGAGENCVQARAGANAQSWSDEQCSLLRAYVCGYCLNGLSLANDCKPPVSPGADSAGCNCGSAARDSACAARSALPAGVRAGVYAEVYARAWEWRAGGTWDDFSGNGRNSSAVTGAPHRVGTTRRGAVGAVLAVRGGGGDVVSFGAMLPTTFTLCSVARYAEGGPYGRVFSGVTKAIYHGFQGGRTDVAFYEGYGTKYDLVAPNPPSTDWQVFCGQNGSPWRFLSDGVDVGTGTPTGGGDALRINDPGAQSGWEVAAFAVWERALTSGEMGTVSQRFLDFLQKGPSHSCCVSTCSAGEELFGTCTAVSDTRCRKCHPGKFKNHASPDPCVPCPTGTYAEGFGSYTCVPCGTGSISSVGAPQCTPCAAGTYQGTGGAQCQDCPEGTWSAPSAGSCTPCKSTCPAGSVLSGSCPARSGSDRQCTACPAGHYKEGTNALGACTLCKSRCGPGYYIGGTECLAGAASDTVQCIPCNAGTFSMGTERSCAPCPSGFTSAAGAASCTDARTKHVCLGVGTSPTCRALVSVPAQATVLRVTVSLEHTPYTAGVQAVSSVRVAGAAYSGALAMPTSAHECGVFTTLFQGYPVADSSVSQGQFLVELSASPQVATARCSSLYSGASGQFYTLGALVTLDYACLPGYYRDVTTEKCVRCRQSCGTGNYISGTCDGRSTSDVTSCAACSTCSAGFYISGVCSGATYADATECSPCTSSCPAGHVLKGTCDGTGRRSGAECVCQASTCDPGFYRPDCTSPCVACRTSCPAGTYMVGSCASGGRGSDVACVPCKSCAAGQYKSATCSGLTTADTTVCTGCLTSCGSGNYIASPACTGTEEQDRTCAPCKITCGTNNYKVGTCSGTYTEDTILCSACQRCRNGYSTLGFCNGFGNRDLVQCTCGLPACGSGTWRASCAEQICVPCTSDCGAGNYLSLSCDGARTYDANLCTKCDVCQAGQYVTSGCDGRTTSPDISCATCRPNCTAGFYISGSCQSAGFRDNIQCIPCKACPEGQLRRNPCNGLGTADESECVATPEPTPEPLDFREPAGQGTMPPQFLGAFDWIVEITVNIPLTVSEFDSQKQENFTNAVRIASPSAKLVSILTIVASTGRRRMLLQTSIDVTFQSTYENFAGAQQGVLDLAQGPLSAAMQSQGLPAVTIIGEPIIREPLFSRSGGPPYDIIGAIVGGVFGFAILALILYSCVYRKRVKRFIMKRVDAWENRTAKPSKIKYPDSVMDGGMLMTGRRMVFTPLLINIGENPSFTISQPLPEGLRFDTTNGSIYGTPLMETQDTRYTVTVNHANDSVSETLRFSVIQNIDSCDPNDWNDKQLNWWLVNDVKIDSKYSKSIRNLKARDVVGKNPEEIEQVLQGHQLSKETSAHLARSLSTRSFRLTPGVASMKSTPPQPPPPSEKTPVQPTPQPPPPSEKTPVQPTPPSQAEMMSRLQKQDSEADFVSAQPTLMSKRLKEGCLSISAGDKAQQEDLPGDMWKQYKAETFLQVGSRGAVMRGQELTAQGDAKRPVAIKVLHAGGGRIQPKERRRLRREANLLSGIDHPNLVKMLECKLPKAQDCFWVVMQHHEGLSVLQLYDRDGAFSQEECIKMAQDVLAGLSAVHALQVLHRDIHPTTICEVKADYGSRTKYKIMDLGMACTDRATEEGYSWMSQPQIEQEAAKSRNMYLAPEVFPAMERTFGPITAASDLWSLAVIMFQLMTGEMPFANEPVPEYQNLLTPREDPADMVSKICDPQRPVADIRAVLGRKDTGLKPESVSDSYIGVIGKALSKQQINRYMTAEEMAHDLYQCIVESGQSIFTIYLSYRLATDAPHARLLFDALNDTTTPQGHHVSVYLDQERIVQGGDEGAGWERSFSEGLMKSYVFVPLISHGATAPLAGLQLAEDAEEEPAHRRRLTGRDDDPDMVLKEWQMALALMEPKLQKRIGHIKSIYPLFVGKQHQEGHERYPRMSNYFTDGSHGGGGMFPDAISAPTTDDVAKFLGDYTEVPSSVRLRTIKETVDAVSSLAGARVWDHPTRVQAVELSLSQRDLLNTKHLDKEQLCMLKAEIEEAIGHIHAVVDETVPGRNKALVPTILEAAQQQQGMLLPRRQPSAGVMQALSPVVFSRKRSGETEDVASAQPRLDTPQTLNIPIFPGDTGGHKEHEEQHIRKLSTISYGSEEEYQGCVEGFHTPDPKKKALKLKALPKSPELPNMLSPEHKMRPLESESTLAPTHKGTGNPQADALLRRWSDAAETLEKMTHQGSPESVSSWAQIGAGQDASFEDQRPGAALA